jgi:hypothetical protein
MRSVLDECWRRSVVQRLEGLEQAVVGLFGVQQANWQQAIRALAADDFAGGSEQLRRLCHCISGALAVAERYAPELADVARHLWACIMDVEDDVNGLRQRCVA